MNCELAGMRLNDFSARPSECLADSRMAQKNRPKAEDLQNGSSKLIISSEMAV
jgi:hypothetical protein